MKSNDFVSWIGSVVGGVFTATQTNQIFQIVSLIATILSTSVALAYTIWKWWRKAKEDGKISEEEIDNLMDDVHQIVNKDKKEGEDKDE